MQCVQSVIIKAATAAILISLAVWQALAAQTMSPDDPYRSALEVILPQGPLGRRILRGVGGGVSP